MENSRPDIEEAFKHGGEHGRPLVVLSNRGPYARTEVRGVAQWTRTVGGLVSAIDPALRLRSGVWICGADAGHADAPPREIAGYEIVTVPLSDEEMEGYYRRVANGVLWPLMHSFPTRVCTKDAPWEVYRDVNRRFAERAAEYGTRPLYWVQDFQLALVPRELRALVPRARIGWFNHVPFPAPEVFTMLPDREDMLTGLLGADLLGFQTPRDVHNFMASVEELTPYDVDTVAGTIEVDGGRVVTTGVFPIGIDIDAIQAMAADPDVKARRERMREDYGGLRVLLAVDRLDYTKGMPERLEAFADFLRRYPQWRQRVCLVQVAVPSRIEVPQYAELKRDVDELVGRINGRFGTPTWTPIQYVNRGFDLHDLVALYTLADVALITPLRDGMNLVAHEFVASRVERTGVLVLSEFAGAATILDGAITVNPYDIPRTADAIAEALEVPADQQEEHMRRLQTCVRKHKITHWQDAFLDALDDQPHRPSVTGRLRRISLA